jgi:hypothetical protein
LSEFFASVVAKAAVMLVEALITRLIQAFVTSAGRPARVQPA